jgi:hypothetical protein
MNDNNENSNKELEENDQEEEPNFVSKGYDAATKIRPRKKLS